MIFIRPGSVTLHRAFRVQQAGSEFFMEGIMGNLKNGFVPARRWRLFLSALAVGILAAPSGLTAARHGVDLRLLLLDGTQLRGELLAVKGEDLLVQGRSGSGIQVGIRDIAEVHIVRENRVGKGIIGGLAAGFALGCLISIPYMAEEHNEMGLYPLVVLGGVGGGFGALAGLGAGLIASSDEKIYCRDRSESWRNVALKRFQRLARFRDVDGPLAGSSTMPAAAAATLPPVPAQEKFRRWHLGSTILHTLPSYTRAARAFSNGLRYGDPITAGPVASARRSDYDGVKNWLGLDGISCGYSLDRRWTIGFLFNPRSRRDYISGDKTMEVSGMAADTNWYMDIQSHAYFLTASYSVVVADGFPRDKALRLNAGLGWNRTRFNYREYGYKMNAYSYDDPTWFNYSGGTEVQSSSAISAMIEAEAVHYFNTRWTLALDAGFRYVPLRVRAAETAGFINWKEPLPDQSPVLTIPGTTLNIGGFYCGIKLGFNL
jgi:hypothetical protein